MIRILERLWIGNSHDESSADLLKPEIGAILNVAHDLEPTRGWSEGVEYMHIGLIDGPGNMLSAYYAALFGLHSLLQRGKVLLCCHTMGRSFALALMYLNATNRFGWDGVLNMLCERIDVLPPEPHAAHKEAFEQLNWKHLAEMMK